MELVQHIRSAQCYDMKAMAALTDSISRLLSKQGHVESHSTKHSHQWC